MKRLLAIVLPLFAASLLSSAQTGAAARYRILTTSKTSTMLKEVNEAAAEGFRAKLACRTGGGELAVLMEKRGDEAPPRTYRLVAASLTSTFEKEVVAASKDGFRVLPRTLTGGKGELIVLLESLDGKVPEYKLFATTYTGTLSKEIREAAAAGFRISGAGSRREHVVLMEREAGAQTPAPEYQLLATQRTGTMQSELNEWTAKGFALAAAAPTDGNEIIVALEKTAAASGGAGYKLLATARAFTLEAELNSEGRRGMRLDARSVVPKRAAGSGGKSWMGTPGRSGSVTSPGVGPSEIVALMERAPAAGSGSGARSWGRGFEYVVLDTMRISTLQQEMDEAAGRGFEMVAMTVGPAELSGFGGPVAKLIVIGEKAPGGSSR